MSTSSGRALRAAVTLACALLALVAGTAAAYEPTESPATLTLLNGSYDAETNTWTVDANRSLTVTLEIGGAEYEPFINEFPEALRPFFCNTPDFTGFYLIVGAILRLPWQPSLGARAGTRAAGPSNWVNVLGRATVPAPRCETSQPVSDQVLLNEDGTFLVELTIRLCQARDGSYVLTGSSVGPDGRPVSYLVPPSPATGTWQVYTLEALGQIEPEHEQMANLNVVNLPDPSESCGLA